MTLVIALAIIGLLSAVFLAGYALALKHIENSTNTYADLSHLNTDTPIDAQVRRDLGIE